MKQESMKILFFIRKSRLKKNGEAPIFLRVTINGQLLIPNRLFMPTCLM